VNYREGLAWLYATQKFGIKLGLENTERLLRALRIGELGQIIHVAGTNGKGSVCAMIDSICRAAKYRAGLFTSPHLVLFRERIRVNGEMISEVAVAQGLTEIRRLAADWDPHPTFFEITTALALRHFQSARCEIVVLETGMGGRLDATNALKANVSVITPIDLDHQKWLGHSIAEIAAEKAGIIKPNVPVISAPQRKEPAEVIARRARQCDSPLEFVREQWTKSKIALRGACQQWNAALAVAAVQRLGPSIPKDAVRRGLQTVEWPARFQIWNERTVIDGAHNPAGARTLVQTWHDEFDDERATIVFAVLHDKNIAKMIGALTMIASRFILPQIRSVRAVPPEEIAALVSSLAPSLPCSITESVAESLWLAQREDNRILITGSLHFAGEALAHLRGEPDSLEDCMQ
jgi:dihydrofolate synthase / folylpolyglutamate synthase